MTYDIEGVLAFLAALGSGLMAGTFFAFSSFVMGALARLPPDEGIAAMRSINIVVLNPTFLGVFMGTALLSTLVVLFSLADWADPRAGWIALGSVAYLAGTFLVTLAANVPLNSELAAAPPARAGDDWTRYLKRWTAWNHVRSAAALLALACFALAVC